MATCDLCLKQCPAANLTQLRDIYQINGVEDVCPECRKWADVELDKIRDGIAKTMRERIAGRSEGFSLRVAHATKHKWTWRGLFARGEGK